MPSSDPPQNTLRGALFLLVLGTLLAVGGWWMLTALGADNVVSSSRGTVAMTAWPAIVTGAGVAIYGAVLLVRYRRR